MLTKKVSPSDNNIIGSNIIVNFFNFPFCFTILPLILSPLYLKYKNILDFSSIFLY